jgi:CHAT domain-containing protein
MLWNALMGPVCERLEGTGTRTLVILPQGGFQLFPLHAAWRESDGRRRYVVDDYCVRYTPSADVLRECQRHASQRNFRNALAVAVRRYWDPRLRPLRHAAIEAAGVADVTGAELLQDRDATTAAVIARAAEFSHLHFACHATFAEDPLDAALQLGGLDRGSRDELTAWRLVAEVELRRARLVTLAACESGVVEHLQSPDEYVGLPGALLQAGAAGVISSLWAVHDLACAVLWRHFYELHVRCRQEPDAALRAVQLWLRDLSADGLRSIASEWRQREFPIAGELDALAERADIDGPPFRHPTFWAAFTYTGA